MDDRNDDLAAAIRELTATLELLREELDAQGPRRPPLRPPTPREVTRFGDEIAIPALIALLEANVRALKALQRGLKVARAERTARGAATDAAGDAADRTKRRSKELRETTLSHLDRALNELQDAVSGGSIETDDRTRTLLEDAKRLRADLDQRLASLEAETHSRESEFDGSVTRIDIESGSAQSDDTTDVDDHRTNTADVDVDAELETLKDQYAPSSDETDESEEANGEAGESESSASADDGDGASDVASSGDGNDGTDDDSTDGTDDDSDDPDTTATGSR
ncbi:hypothetical protein ACLI4Q_13570 [Natrialbaceae archaeon A-CW1-1]